MRVLVLLLIMSCSTEDKQAVDTVPVDTGTSMQPTEPEGDDTGDTDDPVEDPIADDYRSATYCADCHPTHYAEWEQSMHRYAAHSPVFDEMTAKAIRDTAGATGTFCTGCHTPIGTLDGEPGTTKAAGRSEISLEGVTCTVCHQAVSHETPVGNTSLVLDFDAVMQGPFEPVSSAGHASEKGELISTPELCGSCHDVFNFPGLRIEEAYSEYLTSPARDEGLRCQDCHMSPNPGVPSTRDVGPAAVVEGVELPDRTLSSHRFIGPDYSLLDDFPYNDEERSAAAQEEMFTQIQTLLTNAVHIADAYLEESTESATLSVVVENKTSGHNVPTGFTSERQLWLSVDVIEDGETIWSSGDLDSWGDLRDPLSWDVIAGDVEEDEQLVNFQSLNLFRIGNVAITTLNVHETVFPFDADFISRRSLAPLEMRTLTYTLPPLSESARIEIGLHYRNLPPYVLNALQLNELVERLRIFTLDEVVLEGV